MVAIGEMRIPCPACSNGISLPLTVTAERIRNGRYEVIAHIRVPDGAAESAAREHLASHHPLVD